VRLLDVAPPRLAVTAELPIAGQELRMDTTRPFGIPELDASGWPGLIAELEVSDAEGQPLAVTPVGDAGWQLAHPSKGRLTLRYEVDYSPLANLDWPAPLESGLASEDYFVLAGRSLFIISPESGSSRVTFELPAGWQPVTGWEELSGPVGTFLVRNNAELAENLVALSRLDAEVVTAGGFSLRVLPMGHWQGAREEVRQVIDAVIPHFVALMGFDGRDHYLAVLMPMPERGGESFRNGFAMVVEEPPSVVNRPQWGNTLAHEIFHYWNGWRLQGADYATSQWFQEGFTEYAANVAMVACGLISRDEFAAKLSVHVANYRQLTTSLEAGGSHKGPPLYSGGALVAFSWDVLIRRATHGQRNLGDFLRELWRQTESGQRPYEWRDIRSALEATAAGDWQGFFEAHIGGVEPLPLDEILSAAALRWAAADSASPRIEVDPAAPASARSRWLSITGEAE
jgi:predicted metalloprotease with PDZ domain